MANTFNIVISATDRATSTVRKVNDAMSRLTRPFDQVGKTFKSLGRELGFEKIGKNLSSIGRTAGTAAREVGSIVAPMAALTGVASVAGVLALADSWADLGRSITYSAQSIGIGTGQLQSYEGAAKLAGIASGTMTASLQTLGDTMQDALYGRNQQALMVLNRLGVGIKRTKDGAVDAAAEFKSLAAAIYKIRSPQAQKLAASQFGLTELLPLIRQGPAAFAKLAESAKASGAVIGTKDIEAATQFAASLSSLTIAGQGLRNSIGNAIIPAIKPLVDQLSVWVARNRELISSKVGEWARDFGKWVQNIDWKSVGRDVTDFARGVGKVVDAMGGIKGVAITAGAALGVGFVANVVSLTLNLGKMVLGLGAVVSGFGAMETAAGRAAAAATGLASAGAVGVAGALGWGAGSEINKRFYEGTEAGDRVGWGVANVLSFFGNQEAADALKHSAKRDWLGNKVDTGPSPIDPKTAGYVAKFFQSQGWSSAQAAGLSANFATESGFNAGAVGDSGQAYGIGQWHKDRQDAFARWSGHNIRGSSLDEQLRFAQFELTKGSETSAGALLAHAKTAREAGAIVSQAYERPADAAGEAGRRGDMAESFSRLPGAAPAGPYSQAAPASPTALHVEVTLKNAPIGTKVDAVAKGGNATASARIGRSAVGDIA